MLFNYNTYSKFDVQYSLDNSTWSTVGSFTLANAKEWVEQTFSLPAEANNQATIYIRWIADKTSPKVGTLSENDGISISDIYITGTEGLRSDNLEEINRALSKFSGEQERITDVIDLFPRIKKICGKRKAVVIIDRLSDLVENFDEINAYIRGFNPTYTTWANNGRSNSTRLAVCLGD